MHNDCEFQKERADLSSFRTIIFPQKKKKKKKGIVIWLLDSTGKPMNPSILVKRWPPTPASTSPGLSFDQEGCKTLLIGVW